MAEEKKEEKLKPSVKLVEVPASYATVFQLPDGTQLDGQKYLEWLGNEILAIRKAVA
jgi:hypothetical protein